jgi:AmiR/NasT family two-component response regulator
MAGGRDEHLSYRIHQATGMVAAQVGCGIDEALARLKIRANTKRESLEDTALDVLDGEVRFDA